MQKYKIHYIRGVAHNIGKQIKIKGGIYSESILDTSYPSNEQLASWTNIELKKWNKENNKRMRDICIMLNSTDTKKVIINIKKTVKLSPTPLNYYASMIIENKLEYSGKFESIEQIKNSIEQHIKYMIYQKQWPYDKYEILYKF